MTIYKLSDGFKNKKLKKTIEATGIYAVSFDLPAGLTCPGAGLCKADCYARAGQYACNKAKINNNAINYAFTQAADFVPTMASGLKAECDKHDGNFAVRLHATGDFYSPNYFKNWVTIAGLVPSAQIYAYTKSVHIVKTFDGTIPDNLHICFSYGGWFDGFINPSVDCCAAVFPDIETAEAAGYNTECNNNDFAFWMDGGHKKNGLIYHGPKGSHFERTAWANVKISP